MACPIDQLHWHVAQSRFARILDSISIQVMPNLTSNRQHLTVLERFQDVAAALGPLPPPRAESKDPHASNPLLMLKIAQEKSVL
jgi:hypothetical protein